jgi:sugar lactone lactonase YvrE
MAGSEWQISARTHDRLGESALWHPEEQALYWIDFYGPSVHRLKDGVVKSWTFGVGKMIGSLVFVDQGRLILAIDQTLHVFDPANGETARLGGLAPGSTDIAFNDGKVDRAGRYWLGTFEITETKPDAAFYRVSPSGDLSLADGGFIVCNGPSFSPDNRTLYFSDSVGRRIFAYDLDPSGNLSRRRTFHQFSADDGMPDGLAVDSEGHLWCALYGAGKVVRFSPAGEIALSLSAPVANVTSLCFGGPDLRTLHLTTGWSSGTTEATKQQDDGGCLFTRQVECAGLPEPVFRLSTKAGSRPLN